MKSELAERNHSTILVVADNSNMLMILNQILTAKGYRVLLARESASATRLLDLEFGIDSAMIRTGLTGAESIELACLRRGVGVLFLGGIVEAVVIRLKVPESRSEHLPRILILDDEPVVRALFERSLGEDGYLVNLPAGPGGSSEGYL